jgi:A118 family predicted phage portal protein
VLFNEEELKRMRKQDGYYFVYEDVKQPFFSVFKPAIANNFNTKSPMGVSVIANSINVLEGIDTTYHAMIRDVELSRKRMMINADATKTQIVKENDGENVSIRKVQYFDGDDELLMSIPMGEGADPFKVFAPEYQSDSHIQALNHQFNILSSKTGFGTNYYSFDAQKGMTATEVISRNSDTWKNRSKHVKRLKETLINLMYSILALDKSINGYGGDLDLEYDVYFDDSIIEDDAKRLQDMKTDVDSGYIPPYKYLMERYKLSEEDAKRWVKEAEGDMDFSALEGIEAADRDDT